MQILTVKKSVSKIAVAAFKYINLAWPDKSCNVCGKRFCRFTTFMGGSKSYSAYLRELHVIGSDPDHFGCYYCGANDRERHLFLFFDRLNFWTQFRGKSILHFAPEIHLAKRIAAQMPEKYVRGDLFPSRGEIVKIDATAIPFPDQSFDWVICNHVLEHIPDYARALAEFHRVLKPGGRAILQTPYSTRLQNNFEDPGIDKPALRTIFYGQHDHVRVFAERKLFGAFENAEFHLDRIPNSRCLTPAESDEFGINANEDLLLCLKR